MPNEENRLRNEAELNRSIAKMTATTPPDILALNWALAATTIATTIAAVVALYARTDLIVLVYVAITAFGSAYSAAYRT